MRRAILLRLISTLFAFLVSGTAAQAASFWDRFPVHEPDACQARIEKESEGAKQLTGELGPEDFAALKGARVLVIEAELKEGDYSGIDFSGFFFEDAVMSERSLIGAKFNNAIFDSGVFTGSDLTDADFSGATLCSADFTEAKLANARFKGALLISADFSLVVGATARFESAKIYGGIFNSANFDKAVFRSVRLYCRPEGMDQPCSSAEPSSFKEADFTDAAVLFDLDANFTSATFESAAVIAELIPRLKESFFVRLEIAPQPLGPEHPPLTLTRQDVSLLIEGWNEQVVAGTSGPAFDCREVASRAEIAVCRSPELAARDLFLAKLYDEALVAAPAEAEDLRLAQQEWLKTRDACAAQKDAACLPDVYDQRAFALASARRQAGIKALLAGGYDPVADFATVPRNVLGSELGRRLAALRAHSIGGAVVESPDEAGFDFSADSLGGGGHTCSLSGEFTYEATRGVYVHRVDGLEIAQVIPAGDMILFLGAQDYCGLRAQWPRVMRLQGAAN